MEPLFHFASTAVVMPIGFQFFDYRQVIGFFLAGAFLDIDHYFFFLFKFRQLSLIKAWQFYLSIRHQVKKVFCLFHTLEFLLLIMGLVFILPSKLLTGFLVGLTYHLLIDLAQAIYYREVNYRFWSLWQYLTSVIS